MRCNRLQSYGSRLRLHFFLFPCLCPARGLASASSRHWPDALALASRSGTPIGSEPGLNRAISHQIQQNPPKTRGAKQDARIPVFRNRSGLPAKPRFACGAGIDRELPGSLCRQGRTRLRRFRRHTHHRHARPGKQGKCRPMRARRMAGALHPSHQNAGMELRDGFHNGVGRIAILDNKMYREIARPARCRTPPAWRHTGFGKAAASAAPRACNTSKRALKSLRQRTSRSHRCLGSLVPFHGQQHRSARSGAERAGIPVGGHRHYRAGRLAAQGARQRRPPPPDQHPDFPWSRSQSAPPCIAGPRPPASAPPCPAESRNGCKCRCG